MDGGGGGISGTRRGRALADRPCARCRRSACPGRAWTAAAPCPGTSRKATPPRGTERPRQTRKAWTTTPSRRRQREWKEAERSRATCVSTAAEEAADDEKTSGQTLSINHPTERTTQVVMFAARAKGVQRREGGAATAAGRDEHAVDWRAKISRSPSRRSSRQPGSLVRLERPATLFCTNHQVIGGGAQPTVVGATMKRGDGGRQTDGGCGERGRGAVQPLLRSRGRAHWPRQGGEGASG